MKKQANSGSNARFDSAYLWSHFEKNSILRLSKSSLTIYEALLPNYFCQFPGQ